MIRQSLFVTGRLDALTRLCVVSALILAAGSVAVMVAHGGSSGPEVRLPHGPDTWKVTMLVQGKSAGDAQLFTAAPLEGPRQHASANSSRDSQSGDHDRQAFTANGADDAFHVGTLPRGPRCRQNFLDSHGFHILRKLTAEDPVAVSNQITRNLVKGKGLPELLRSPLVVAVT